MRFSMLTLSAVALLSTGCSTRSNVEESASMDAAGEETLELPTDVAEGGESLGVDNAGSDELSLDSPEGESDSLAQSAKPAAKDELGDDSLDLDDASLDKDATASAVASTAKKDDASDELSLDEMPADESDASMAPTAVASTAAASQEEVAAPRTARASSDAYRGSRFPKRVDAPFQKGNFWMNGFYFVREEQSWAQLSQAIYGRGDRSQLLSEWNEGHRPVVGMVVYYNSPFRPEDSSQMKVLADDFGFPMENITVNEGETLSTIARDKLGHSELWREVASLNQDLLKSPDVVYPGQTLKLQPREMNTQGVLQQVIAQTQATPAPEAAPVQVDQAAVAVAQNDQTAQNAQPAAPPAVQVAQQPVAHAAVEAEKVSGEEETSILDSLPLSMENLAIGAGVLVILGVLMMLRKKRRSNQDMTHAGDLTNGGSLVSLNAKKSL